jgi:hypothetical protein
VLKARRDLGVRDRQVALPPCVAPVAGGEPLLDDEGIAIGLERFVDPLGVGEPGAVGFKRLVELALHQQHISHLVVIEPQAALPPCIAAVGTSKSL